jgi:hypothetical protein
MASNVAGRTGTALPAATPRLSAASALGAYTAGDSSNSTDPSGVSGLSCWVRNQLASADADRWGEVI